MTENRITNWYCGKCGERILNSGHVCKDESYFIQVVDKTLMSQLELIVAEMEEHRQRYTDENAKDGNDYWRGRRDEAGYFRDKLKAILEKLCYPTTTTA